MAVGDCPHPNFPRLVGSEDPSPSDDRGTRTTELNFTVKAGQKIVLDGGKIEVLFTERRSSTGEFRIKILAPEDVKIVRRPI